MSKEKEVSLSGMVSFWSLGSDTNLTVLESGLSSLGLGRFTPDETSDLHALKAALTEVCGESRRLIRPLHDRSGYAIVAEKEDGTGGLQHETEFTLRVVDGALAGTPGSRTPEPEERQQLLALFRKHKGSVPHSRVTRMLVSIVSYLNGVPLRDSGGIYWLPETMVPTWKVIAGVVEAASSGRRNSIYQLKTAMDDSAKRAVCDALVRDVEKAVEVMEEELHSGTLGHRACSSREGRANKLLFRVESYEKMLGKTLNAVKDSVNAAGALAAGAAIAALV